MARVEDVGHAEPHRHPGQVLALDERADEPRALPAARHFSRVEGAGEMVVLRIEAIGELAVRDVLAEREARPAIVVPADRAIDSGQRIANARAFEAQGRVQLGAAPADRIELDRAGAFQPVASRARQIADAFAARADGDDIDDVVDAMRIAAQPGLAPLPQFAADFALQFPALRRDEVGIAGILAILLEVGLRQEVVEADLADAAAQLEARIPPRRRPPAERNAALGAEELARWQIAVDSIERALLGAEHDLQVELGAKRAAERRGAFVAHFLDLARPAGERRRIEADARRQLEQRSALVERIERALERNLPRALAGLPRLFGAADGFADQRIAAEANAVAGRPAVEIGDLSRHDRFVGEMAQPDQLEAARPHAEIIVAADIVIDAVELGHRRPDEVVAVDARPNVAVEPRIEIGRERQRQVALGRSRPLAPELGLGGDQVRF